MANDPLPIDFRQDIINKIRHHLEAGDSCALVGVGSSGKSNIARHLARHDVRLHHFPQSAPQTLVLYVNCKPLAYQQPRDVYLEILDQLEHEIEELDGGFTPVRAEVVGLRQDAQSNPELLARRDLDRALDKVIKAGARHVLIILDDCDDLFAKAPPRLFSDLRGLRDNYKHVLAYLLVTRTDPALLSETREYEELFELLSTEGHTIPVTPYNEVDGRRMIERLVERQAAPRNFSDSDQRRIYELSGGHAGLIRSIFYAAWNGVPLQGMDDVERLLAVADVEEEASKIWDSLLPDEREALLKIVRREPAPDTGLARLRRRELVRRRGRTVEIVSPVFERFVTGQAWVNAPSAPVVIELTGMDWQVRADGRLITNLTRTEYELLKLLVQNKPKVCPFSELIIVMHRTEQTGNLDRPSGNPPRRLREYMLRLKAKLGVPGESTIVQEKDGYRLVA